MGWSRRMLALPRLHHMLWRRRLGVDWNHVVPGIGVELVGGTGCRQWGVCARYQRTLTEFAQRQRDDDAAPPKYSSARHRVGPGDAAPLRPASPAPAPAPPRGSGAS